MFLSQFIRKLLTPLFSMLVCLLVNITKVWNVFLLVKKSLKLYVQKKLIGVKSTILFNILQLLLIIYALQMNNNSTIFQSIVLFVSV